MDENTDKNQNEDTRFLHDLTDGRRPGLWKSRYGTDAQSKINWEKRYIIFVFIISIVCTLSFGIISEILLKNEFIALINLKIYFYSWMGGTLGGLVFSAKWLVHSVAKYTWNEDRRLWRIFTPHLSGALSFTFIILISSKLLNITDPDALDIHKSYAIGFLVGYFSDNAIGKMTEIAQVFFGSSISKGK